MSDNIHPYPRAFAARRREIQHYVFFHTTCRCSPWHSSALHNLGAAAELDDGR